MSEDQSSGIDFKKILADAKPEDHSDFVKEVNQDEADSRGAYISQLMEENYVTYNYLVGQVSKFIEAFQMAPSEMCFSYVLASAIVLGALCPDKEIIQAMFSMSKELAVTLHAEGRNPDGQLSPHGLKLRAVLLDTGQKVEAELLHEIMKDLIKSGGPNTAKKFDPNRDPRTKHIRDRVAKYQSGTGKII